MKTLTLQQWGMILGCDVICEKETFVFTGIEFMFEGLYLVGPSRGNASMSYPAIECKPILRKLESMKEEEAKEYAALYFVNCDTSLVKLYHISKVAISIRYMGASLHLPGELTPKQFTWLLSKHFDLFGWIEQGLAIDRQTLNEKK